MIKFKERKSQNLNFKLKETSFDLIILFTNLKISSVTNQTYLSSLDIFYFFLTAFSET